MPSRMFSRARPGVAVFAAALLFLAGFGIGRGSAVPDPELALMGEAYDQISRMAARLPSDGALSREAIRGMLAALEDGYAEFLPRDPGPDGEAPVEGRALGIDVQGLSGAAGLSGQILEPGIGHVALRLFSPGSGLLARAEVNRLRAVGARGVVLDLRGNPGGLVDEALQLAGVFVGDRVVFRYETATGGTGDRYGIGEPLRDVAVVVLVDGETASAGELVAGAIQDHGRGLVVGEPTTGKATVQRVVSLSDGSAIKFTTARYLTPQGRSVDARGIRPDVHVPGPGEQQLAQAQAVLRTLVGE